MNKSGFSINELNTIFKKSFIRLLKMHFESGVGHIGGNLSCLQLLLYLYHKVMIDQDHFILSKGHAAGALYIALWSKGVFIEEDLRTFHKNGTKLTGHPIAAFIPEIPFSTGSLGHGLSLAAGVALSKKLKQEPGRVYCLMSDGEWNEGSNWEALIFSVQNKLDNLTIIIDHNGLQGYGFTEEVAKLDPLSVKFTCFGCDVQEINGHSFREMDSAFNYSFERPAVIVANTIKGFGVSFMEYKLEWHYLPLSEELLNKAMEDAEAIFENL